MTDNDELLRQYAETGSEKAFAELVLRNLPLVYSAALRQVGGDEQLAKDVAQSVFTDLARKAASLRGRGGLTGWLYTSAQFAAANAVRAHRRRQIRERAAVAMQGGAFNPTPEPAWDEISPVLDAAMAELNSAEKTAVLLRFFESKELKAVGQALGISEDAARMRVNRALEKLRDLLARRGLTSAPAALGAALCAHAVQGAPAGLAACLSSTALTAAASAAAVTTSTTSLLQLMASTKFKISLAALLAASFATPLILQHHALQRLTAENVELRQRLAAVQQRPPPTAADDIDPNELVRLRAEHDELLRSRGQLTQLRRERDELLKLAGLARGVPKAKAAQSQYVDSAWIQRVLDSPPAQQGSAAGALRGKSLRKEIGAISASELALKEALVQRQLNNTLEHSPVDFADFQAAFIQAAIGLTDAAQVGQIHQIIQQSYEQAVADGLDIPSKPPTDAESWVQRRHQLDRQATAEVQRLLTPEQRPLFGLGFIGVMGVDLGGEGVDASNYPPGFLGPEKPDLATVPATP
jgi:RNA polymerase sigma factor (sigma-70 family)